VFQKGKNQFLSGSMGLGRVRNDAIVLLKRGGGGGGSWRGNLEVTFIIENSMIKRSDTDVFWFYDNWIPCYGVFQWQLSLCIPSLHGQFDYV
jgi:hypothetical protein